MSSKLTKISLIFISFSLLFLFRYWQTQEIYKEGERVAITSRINTEPQIIGKRQRFAIGKLRVFLPRHPEVHYGDLIRFEDVVKMGKAGPYIAPQEFEAVMEAGILSHLKQKILTFFRSTLPEPEASLVAGITLGTKSAVPQGFFEQLKSSGTLHVVVASGMNVTLVARFLIGVLVLFLNRKIAIPVAVIGIWAYVFLVGLEAPLIRAAIMGTLSFVAQGLGRLSWAWWGLGVASGAMLLVNPAWLSDLGFLLSFGATAGILAFERPIQERLKLVPILREDLSTTLAAQIVTTPIIFASFGQFSLFSPLANTLVLWTVAPIMVISGAAAFLYFLFEPIGRFILLLSYPLALFFVKVVSLF